MSTIIRKISVGRDYPNGILHYQLHHKLKLKDKRYEITGIMMDRDLLELGKTAYNIYVKNVPLSSSDIVSEVLWKTIIDVPVVVENDIDFS